MPDIELPDAVVASLNPYPQSMWPRQIERAINLALDQVGWPKVSDQITYWYVNIWNRDKSLRGHVGPLPDLHKARAVGRSWRSAGYSAVPGNRALGRSLTHAWLDSAALFS